MSPRRRKPAARPVRRRPARRAAARGRRRPDVLQDAAWARARGRRRVAHARAGQDARHRGRVGLGQVGALAFDHGPAARATSSAHGSIKFEGREIGDADNRRDAQLLGHADVDGVPGPDDLAQPGHEDRQADHRVAALPPRREPRLRATTPRSALLAVGRDPRGRTPARGVPAPAVGRHAPACDDRDRARRAVRSCCSPTSRRPRSTSPCRRRSSTCSRRSSASGSWRWCS